MTFELKDATLCGQDGAVLLSDLSFVVGGGQLVEVSVGRGAALPLLQVLQGIMPLREGVVSIDGEPMTEQSCPYLRRLMGYVPRDIKKPDGSERIHSAAEMRKMLFDEVALSHKSVVLVDGLRWPEERTLCQRMADDGSAVLVVGENEI